MWPKLRAYLEATARRTKRILVSRQTKRLLLWCAPALVAGLVLRVVLMAQMPHAFYHDDTRFVFSPAVHVSHGEFDFSGRRPYLVPVLYAVPLVLHLPFLSAVAVFQHALGLVLIVGVGLLCQWWFRAWRWIIVPVTLLIALNPVLLWFEHAALPEYLFIFTALMVVLAGTACLRHPSLARFVLLFVVLFLNAGTRPEANLLFIFGIMVVAAAWLGQWRKMAVMLPLALLLSFIGVKATKTSQGGKLLLTTLIPMIPEHLYTAPGFGERIEPLRTETQREWDAIPHGVNSMRKRLQAVVDEHLLATGQIGDQDEAVVSDNFCRRIAFETLVRSGPQPFFLAYRKFRNSLRDHKLREEHAQIPSGTFGPDYLYKEQAEYMYNARQDKWGSSTRYAKLYLGREPTTEAELTALLKSRYVPFQPDWLTRYQIAYFEPLYAWAPPNSVYQKDEIPGLPYFYPLAVAGLLLSSLVHRPRFLNAPQLWLAMLFLLGFAVFLSGNMIARYRLPFELYWWIGLFAWIEVLAWPFYRKVRSATTEIGGTEV